MLHGVRLTVAYDGTAFAGFQQQPGQRTVQGALAEAAERVCRHPVQVRGASRTDAGVHAEGQVAAFASERALAPERWLLALNRYLPPDAAVRAVEACEPDYDPRFDAEHKTYRYLFHLGLARDPLLRNRVWHLGRQLRRARAEGSAARAALDLGAMQAACRQLLGTHDFHAFRSAGDQRPNTVRTLLKVALEPAFLGNPELLAFEVKGTAFLLNMVRILAGTLFDVGRGRLGEPELARMLSPEGERRTGGMTAPACGLTLVEVNLGRFRARAPASPPGP